MASASVLNILMPLPRYDYENKKITIKSSSAAETVHRYYDLRRHILKIKPKLIISDGDMHALRLAYKWKVRSVFITNVIRPSYGFSPLLVPGQRFTERYVKRCDKIIVPDNPKHAICEYNIGNVDDIGIKDKVEFVGSFIQMTPQEGLKEKHFFVPISGPLGTRAKLAKMIISLGQPGKKTVQKMGNLEIYNWLTEKERDEFMKNAKTIVFSGGHATCFEAIKNRKPSVCVPTQPEQMANAKKMEELKCSISVEKEKELSSALLEIEEKKELFKAHVKKLSEYSSQFNGLDNAVKVIETIV